jgi:hypothetical protein
MPMKMLPISIVLATGLAALGTSCSNLSLDPLHARQPAEEIEQGGGGASGGGSSEGGSASDGGGGSALVPQSALALNAATLGTEPDPDGPNAWSMLVPSDGNIYLDIGTYPTTCRAPWAVDPETHPPGRTMIIELPPNLQHAGSFDLHDVESTYMTEFGNAGFDQPVGNYPLGTVDILAFDAQTIVFTLKGTSFMSDGGTVEYDGLYKASVCPANSGAGGAGGTGGASP